MAETYLTPTFQNAVKPPPPPPPPPPPSAAQNQSSAWTLNPQTWNMPLPQSVQDWGTVAGQEAGMGLPLLSPGKAQADAAKARLGPLAAGSADVVGSVLSPSSLLYALPGGSVASGVLHEGMKSAMAGNDPTTIAEDTAAGGLAGLLGLGAGKGLAYGLPEAIKGGVTGGAAYLGHKALGGWAGGDLLKEAPALFGVYKGVDKLADWAGEQGKGLISSPAAQQAVKSLILGGASATRNAGGPWDQWAPGQ